MVFAIDLSAANTLFIFIKNNKKMKKFIFFYILLMLFGCKKKETGLLYGEISPFYVNQQLMPRAAFNLNVFAMELNKVCPKPHYAIVVEHYAKNDSLWEKIDIGGLSPNKTGKFPLLYRNGAFGNACDSVPNASFVLSYQDVVIALYVVLNKSDSYINIESFNTSTKEVKGTFDITFVANGTSEESRMIYPDTIRFSGAKFKAWIN